MAIVPAQAHGPDCSRVLRSTAQVAFTLLPRGGYFTALSSELQTRELMRVASGFQVRWVSVDTAHRRVVAEIARADSERWLAHLRAHPRVISVMDPAQLTPELQKQKVDRKLRTYMRKLPQGVVFKVLVFFADEQLARAYVEGLMRQKISAQHALPDEFSLIKRGKPVKSVRVVPRGLEVYLEDSNDRMARHLSLIPGTAEQAQAELLSAY